MRTTYLVISKNSNGRIIENELLPNEFHLIKTMLNEGHKILSVTKEERDVEYMKTHFNIYK